MASVRPRLCAVSLISDLYQRSSPIKYIDCDRSSHVMLVLTAQYSFYFLSVLTVVITREVTAPQMAVQRHPKC